jgi:alkylated DNA repair dioxygenase AlkB
VSTPQAELFGAGAALPEGFLYQPEFISVEEERALLEAVAALPLEEAKYRQYTARRRVAYFGFAYDFSANRLGEAAPVPEFLHPLREKIARWMRIAPEAFAHALINEYRPGTPLGWHRDAPDFGRVAGASLGGRARMRLRRYPPGKDKPVVLELAPRSAYQIDGPARWQWQHSIPPTRELRYSVTFRTLLRKD